MRELRRDLGVVIDALHCPLFDRKGGQWDQAEATFRWTTEMSAADSALLFGGACKFVGILVRLISLSFLVLSFAFAAGCLEDSIARA